MPRPISKSSTMPAKKRWVLGMDPGKHGGLVLLNVDKITDQVHIPTPVKDGRVDVVGIVEALKPYADDIVTAFIEDVHSLLGSSTKSSFEFGHAAGSLYGAVQGLLGTRLQVGYVAPPMWQRTAWKETGKVTSPRMDENGKQKVGKTGKPLLDNDPKASSMRAALHLFPGVSFVPKRCRVPHDGLVDAALIAYSVLPENIRETITYVRRKPRKIPDGAVVLTAGEDDDTELYVGPGKERKRLAKARSKRKKK